MHDLIEKIIDHAHAAYPRMVLTPSGVRAVLEAISASGSFVVVPVNQATPEGVIQQLADLVTQCPECKTRYRIKLQPQAARPRE